MEVVNKLGIFEVRRRSRSLFRQYPKAIRHYNSLFPNNYMDVVELEDFESLKNKLDDFKTLLDSKDVKERDILNFIRNHKAYFIIASLLKRYFDFGHHEAYLFRRVPAWNFL